MELIFGVDGAAGAGVIGTHEIGAAGAGLDTIILFSRLVSTSKMCYHRPCRSAAHVLDTKLFCQ